MFDLIALDADDTLWHNMDSYFAITRKYQRILSRFASPDTIEDTLNEAEHRNIPYFGYGIKSFILSCMEAAIIISNGRLTSKEMGKILDLGKEMVNTKNKIIDHVPEVIKTLAEKYPLMLITKGDLLDQERKLERSGLAPCFKYVEIVSNKRPEDYAAILERYNIPPERFLMVGNSLRSDVLPVVAIGGQAVHIPYQTTWVHELVNPDEAAANHYHELESIQLLPTWLEEIGS